MPQPAQLQPPPSTERGKWVVAELADAPTGQLKFQQIVQSLGGAPAKAMLGMTPGFDQAAFRTDCAALRHRLRENSFGLLPPRGRFVQYWDMVTGCALLYTLFVTPFEVGLDLPTRIDALFIVNQCISCIFIVDICVQFFLPVPDLTKGDGAYERRHWKLATRYFKGWFALDVITILPFDILVLLQVLSGPVKGTKLLRIMRLLKLLKVLKSSAIIERWQSSVAITSSNLQLITFSLITVVLLHWFACGWCLLPNLQGSQRGEMGSEHQTALAAALEAKLDVQTREGFPCTGCWEGDPSMCVSPCLTECEVSAIRLYASLPAPPLRFAMRESTPAQSLSQPPLSSPATVLTSPSHSSCKGGDACGAHGSAQGICAQPRAVDLPRRRQRTLPAQFRLPWREALRPLCYIPPRGHAAGARARARVCVYVCVCEAAPRGADSSRTLAFLNPPYHSSYFHRHLTNLATSHSSSWPCRTDGRRRVDCAAHERRRVWLVFHHRLGGHRALRRRAGRHLRDCHHR